MFNLPVTKYAPPYETHAALFTQASQAKLAQSVSLAIEKGIPYEIELELASDKAERRFAVARCEPKLGDDGNVVKLVGTFQDVTAIKHVQLELNRTTIRLSESVKASGIGIWEWDLSTNELFWDDNMFRIYGIDNPEAHNTVELWKNALHSDDTELAIKSIETAINGGPKYDIEFRIVRPNGDIRWVKSDATILQDDTTGNRRMVGTNQDITAQKLANDRIKELEKRNRALLDYSPVCHKIIDLDFKLRYMNSNGFKMLNLPISDEVYGQFYPFSFFQAKAKELMENKLQRVRDNGKQQKFESVAKTVDGQEVWLLHHLIPVPKDDGELDYITVVSADITQRKYQEKQLLNAQKVSLAGQLSAGICHDLNNVLNIISGYAELIELKQHTHDVGQYGEKITQGIERAKSVTDRLLKLAKPREESIAIIDLDELLQNEFRFYEEALPNNTSVIASFNANAKILVDEHTLDDVVMNLVVNAHKALADDGVIHISTRIEPRFLPNNAYVHCEPNDANEYAVLSIKDNGNGIPSNKLDDIFLPFVSERHDAGGSGLGLAVVSAFAVNNQAGLMVNTEVGKGTEFTFWFPVSNEASSQAPHTDEHEKATLAGRSIVIVDDEERLLEAFTDMFEIAGADVTGFSNPEEAKRFIEDASGLVDTLITDQSLGHQIRGGDLVRWAESHYPNINCHIMTGYSADAALDGLSVGIIEKPASIAKVVEQVSTQTNA